MILWRSFVEPAKTSMQTLIIVNVFFWWSPKHWYFLLLQWCLVDDSLRKHLWNSDDLDANINDELCFFGLISEYVIFHCCLSDDSMTRYGGTMEISMQTLKISKMFIVLNFQTLMFHCCFVECSLMSLEEILMKHWCFWSELRW